jgi:arginyl-tRNA synthetase
MRRDSQNERRPVADIPQIFRERFAAALSGAFGPEHAQTDPLIRAAANPKFGDFQANLALGLAKALGAPPRQVAQKIVAGLRVDDLCSKVEIAGPGFINLHLRGEFLGRLVTAMRADARLGVVPAAPTQRVVVDYSGPNVAKEMHVGHLRSTCIGDALARVLGFVGHTVIRQNHLGDWGTQFGMLIEHLSGLDLGPAGSRGIADLNALYQAAKARFDADADFADRARRRVVALQGGDAPTLILWRSLIDESKRHFDQVYRRLGVLLTDADFAPESLYNDRLAPVVEDLQKRGLARVSEGAVCVFPAGFVNQEGEALPLIVRKSDGGYGYAATDLAALHYRVTELHAQRVIYVVDFRQKNHLAMVFAVGAMAGWVGTGVVAEHVAFGTVLGDDGKPFKTRSGEVVKLIDLLDEAEERALAVVTAKNPDLSADQRRAVAHAVGLGAIKYADLCNDRIKDYRFNWDRMLAFDGNTAPYLQNAYVRIRSIFRKAPPEVAQAFAAGPCAVVIDAPGERELALKLLQFPAAVAGVAESLEPHRLCTCLYELATAYHQFYEQCPVLTAANPDLRLSRLTLCDLTARTLGKGLELLGIQTVEQM